VQQSEQVQEARESHDAVDEALAPADWAAADEMRRRTFSVVDQGYDQEEVRAYLTHLAEVFAHQASKLTEFRRVEAAQPQPAPNGAEDAGGLASKMADVLKEAQEHAARLREEAEGEAKLILAGAQQRAEQAEHDVEQIAADARQQVQQDSDRRVAEAEQRAEQAEVAAQQAAAETERRVAEVQAVRDAVLAEVHSAWQRLSQVVSEPVDIPDAVGDEQVVPTPPAPDRPA
jgi:DivIVA protein